MFVGGSAILGIYEVKPNMVKKAEAYASTARRRVLSTLWSEKIHQNVFVISSRKPWI